MKHILYVAVIIFLSACCIGCGEKKENDTLTMGTNAEFPPFETRGGANGEEIIGFDIDVGRRIAKSEGKNLAIEDMKFDSLLPALNSGKVDMVIAGMTVTEDRLRNVDFSEPYYKVTQIVLVQNQNVSKIKTLDDLKNKTIAVSLGTTGDTVASQYTNKIVRFNSAYEAIMELKNNKADLILTDEELGVVLQSKNPDLTRIDLPFEDEYYAIAVKKGNKELLDKINQNLKEMRENGEMKILTQQYFAK